MSEELKDDVIVFRTGLGWHENSWDEMNEESSEWPPDSSPNDREKERKGNMRNWNKNGRKSKPIKEYNSPVTSGIRVPM